MRKIIAIGIIFVLIAVIFTSVPMNVTAKPGTKEEIAGMGLRKDKHLELLSMELISHESGWSIMIIVPADSIISPVSIINDEKIIQYKMDHEKNMYFMMLSNEKANEGNEYYFSLSMLNENVEFAVEGNLPAPQAHVSIKVNKDRVVEPGIGMQEKITADIMTHLSSENLDSVVTTNAESSTRMDHNQQTGQLITIRVDTVNEGSRQSVDSFFDVTYETTTGTNRNPKSNDKLKSSSNFMVDSFFDVFYEPLPPNPDPTFPAESFFDVFFDITTGVSNDGGGRSGSVDPSRPEVSFTPPSRAGYINSCSVNVHGTVTDPGSDPAENFQFDSFFDVFAKIDGLGGGNKEDTRIKVQVLENVSISSPNGDSTNYSFGGGADTETLPDVLGRGPIEVRTRGRAVTVADFESLAMETGKTTDNFQIDSFFDIAATGIFSPGGWGFTVDSFFDLVFESNLTGPSPDNSGYGQSLKNIKIKMSTSTQVSEVVVRGWDPSLEVATHDKNSIRDRIINGSSSGIAFLVQELEVFLGAIDYDELLNGLDPLFSYNNRVNLFVNATRGIDDNPDSDELMFMTVAATTEAGMSSGAADVTDLFSAGTNFTVDSFFDVFVEVGISIDHEGVNAPQADGPSKWAVDSFFEIQLSSTGKTGGGSGGGASFQVDSFFDVFYDSSGHSMGAGVSPFRVRSSIGVEMDMIFVTDRGLTDPDRTINSSTVDPWGIKLEINSSFTSSMFANTDPTHAVRKGSMTFKVNIRDILGTLSLSDLGLGELEESGTDIELDVGGLDLKTSIEMSSSNSNFNIDSFFDISFYINDSDEEERERECPECGAVVGEDDMTCPECGNDLGDDENRVKISGYSKFHTLTRGTPSRTWGNDSGNDTGVEPGSFHVDSFFDISASISSNNDPILGTPGVITSISSSITNLGPNTIDNWSNTSVNTSGGGFNFDSFFDIFTDISIGTSTTDGDPDDDNNNVWFQFRTLADYGINYSGARIDYFEVHVRESGGDPEPEPPSGNNSQPSDGNETDGSNGNSTGPKEMLSLDLEASIGSDFAVDSFFDVTTSISTRVTNPDPTTGGSDEEPDDNATGRIPESLRQSSRTTVNLKFNIGNSSSDGPSLSLAGFDVFHRLTRGTNSRTWGDGFSLVAFTKIDYRTGQDRDNKNTTGDEPYPDDDNSMFFTVTTTTEAGMYAVAANLTDLFSAGSNSNINSFFGTVSGMFTSFTSPELDAEDTELGIEEIEITHKGLMFMRYEGSGGGGNSSYLPAIHTTHTTGIEVDLSYPDGNFNIDSFFDITYEFDYGDQSHDDKATLKASISAMVDLNLSTDDDDNVDLDKLSSSVELVISLTDDGDAGKLSLSTEMGVEFTTASSGDDDDDDRMLFTMNTSMLLGIDADDDDEDRMLFRMNTSMLVGFDDDDDSGRGVFRLNNSITLSTGRNESTTDSFFDVFVLLDYHPPEPGSDFQVDSFFDISFQIESDEDDTERLFIGFNAVWPDEVFEGSIDEVSVGFELGDVRTPFLIGLLYNGNDIPPIDSEIEIILGNELQEVIFKADREAIGVTNEYRQIPDDDQNSQDNYEIDIVNFSLTGLQAGVKPIIGENLLVNFSSNNDSHFADFNYNISTRVNEKGNFTFVTVNVDVYEKCIDSKGNVGKKLIFTDIYTTNYSIINVDSTQGSSNMKETLEVIVEHIVYE
jgi:hypothetical protein